jgi:hypothetical protein
LHPRSEHPVVEVLPVPVGSNRLLVLTKDGEVHVLRAVHVLGSDHAEYVMATAGQLVGDNRLGVMHGISSTGER